MIQLTCKAVNLDPASRSCPARARKGAPRARRGVLSCARARNGLYRAPRARNGSFAARADGPGPGELEGAVQRAHRALDVLARDHARDLDRRGRDHVDVDALLGEHREHARGDAGVRAHAGADDRDLAHLLVRGELRVRLARQRLQRRAPGASGTPVSVSRASAVEWVTAVIRGCSMVSLSASTTVPGASSKDERQWMRTPWLRAYSTERSCSTPAPDAAISSISSKDTIGSLRASGTIRGSALKTPATSVEISQTSAPTAAATATA